MGLVDDDAVVVEQQPVGLGLREQDAIGHELYRALVRGDIGEAHLVAHALSKVLPQLLGDPLGDRAGGDAPGLGVADHAIAATARLVAHLRDLGGLSRAGLACDDDDLVLAYGLHYLVAARGHRGR